MTRLKKASKVAIGKKAEITVDLVRRNIAGKAA